MSKCIALDTAIGAKLAGQFAATAGTRIYAHTAPPDVVTPYILLDYGPAEAEHNAKGQTMWRTYEVEVVLITSGTDGSLSPLATDIGKIETLLSDWKFVGTAISIRSSLIEDICEVEETGDTITARAGGRFRMIVQEV